MFSPWERREDCNPQAQKIQTKLSGTHRRHRSQQPAEPALTSLPHRAGFTNLICANPLHAIAQGLADDPQGAFPANPS
jgi:hypothetical protein